MKGLALLHLKIFTLSLFITFGTQALESKFLLIYLGENLTTILIAFLAVSIATISIVSTKLKEVIDKYNANFSSTIKSLRFSIKEQIFYILLSIIVSVFCGSKLFMDMYSYSYQIIEVIFIYIFLLALYNIYDTANAIFIIFEWEAE